MSGSYRSCGSSNFVELLEVTKEGMRAEVLDWLMDLEEPDGETGHGALSRDRDTERSSVTRGTARSPGKRDTARSPVTRDSPHFLVCHFLVRRPCFGLAQKATITCRGEDSSSGSKTPPAENAPSRGRQKKGNFGRKFDFKFNFGKRCASRPKVSAGKALRRGTCNSSA